MLDRFTRLRRSVAILGLALAGALVIAAGPTGSLADQDNSLSVEQFQPITITDQTFAELEGLVDELDPMTMFMVYIEMQDLGELETDISEESFREVSSIDDVQSHLGDSFLTPSDLPAGIQDGESRFMVGDAGSASYTFDVAKARRISELLEISSDWLPDASEYPQLTVSLHVPESGLVAWKNGEQKLVTGQIGAPDLEIPDAIDLDALRDSLINDPRMPSELQSQLGAIDDWERTLPIPVFEEAEFQDVVVQGNDGLLLILDDGAGVVWESNGTLYVVAGTYSGDEVLEIAESMS